jgi:hypothetical protein
MEHSQPVSPGGESAASHPLMTGQGLSFEINPILVLTQSGVLSINAGLFSANREKNREKIHYQRQIIR